MVDEDIKGALSTACSQFYRTEPGDSFRNEATSRLIAPYECQTSEARFAQTNTCFKSCRTRKNSFPPTHLSSVVINEENSAIYWRSGCFPPHGDGPVTAHRPLADGHVCPGSAGGSDIVALTQNCQHPRFCAHLLEKASVNSP
ncbi:hypothetical protein Bbelb_298450 [Branchiostoma belcheri]|nr:hypothetical protein Bbelb_298450 [Branchiostoma belcheri]